jgi:hypothetical protein
MKYKLTKEQLDRITGGLSDGKTVEDIAKKHGVSVEEINSQLEKGIKVEMEHTNNKNLAREISLDHLYELKDYYTRLSKIEENLNLSSREQSLRWWKRLKSDIKLSYWREYQKITFTPSQSPDELTGREIENIWSKEEQNSTIEEKTDYSKEKKSGLHGWFSRRGGEGSKGWIDCNTCRKNSEGKTKCKPCGREKGEERSKYPACRPTPAACKTKGKGEKWGKKSESIEVNTAGGKNILKRTGELQNFISKYPNEIIYFNLNEVFKLPSEIEREDKKEISEEKLNNIRELIKYYGFEIDNEFINDKQEDYIEYYFDVSSKKYEGRDINIRNKVQIIAKKLGLDFGFDLNRYNLFYFFDDSDLNENSIKVSTEDLKDQKTSDAVKDLIKKKVPVELTEDLSTVDSKGELNFNPTEFTIDDVSTAMDIVKEYEKFVHTSKPKNVITWYEDKLINKIVNYGVKMGWLFRPSVTQVEWTEKGIDELRNLEGEELVEGKKDRCYNIAKRKYNKNSAYRSGAIVRCRKGEIWKNESKEEIKKEIKEMVEKHLKPTITKGDFVKLVLEGTETKNYEIEVIEQDPVPGGSKYCEVRKKHDNHSYKIDYFIADLNNNVIQYHPYIYEHEDEIRKLGYNLPIMRKRGEDEFKCECIKTIKFKSGMNFFKGFKYICKWNKESVTVFFEDGRFTTMSNEIFDDHFDVL